MDFAGYAITAVAAYVLGSIPTGYLMARARGIDIRTVGSGNIGATNVFRILGNTAGVLVLLLDGLKGFVACWGLAGLAADLFFASAGPESAAQEYLAIVAGLAVIVGHNYTCWLRFKGGKGIATSAGVMGALLPKAFAIVLGVWVVVFAISRYVSLASIAAAFLLPLATWCVGYTHRMIMSATIIGALAIYKHKGNIQRLLNGTENRFGSKKPPTPKSSAT